MIAGRYVTVLLTVAPLIVNHEGDHQIDLIFRDGPLRDPHLLLLDPGAANVAERLVRPRNTLDDRILEAALKATNELWAEISAKNADFKKGIDAMQAYRSDQYLWWQVAEYTFDSFQIRSRTRG